MYVHYASHLSCKSKVLYHDYIQGYYTHLTGEFQWPYLLFIKPCLNKAIDWWCHLLKRDWPPKWECIRATLSNTALTKSTCQNTWCQLKQC